eukprot:2799609-Prymnesium_polylepis.2
MGAGLVGELERHVCQSMCVWYTHSIDRRRSGAAAQRPPPTAPTPHSYDVRSQMWASTPNQQLPTRMNHAIDYD